MEALYSGRITNLTRVRVSSSCVAERYNESVLRNRDNLDLLRTPDTPSSITDFDRHSQNQWLMPLEYQQTDIEQIIISKCNTTRQRNRVNAELSLFRKHNMIMVLRYLHFLVDTMLDNEVLWGVGRGSSVSSYCLFLLGVHRIDSLKYDLDIHEFIRE